MVISIPRSSNCPVYATAMKYDRPWLVLMMASRRIVDQTDEGDGKTT